jgi:hypothetical protein
MRSTGTGTRAGVLGLLIFTLTGAGITPAPSDCPPPQEQANCFDAGHAIVDGVRYLLLVCDGGILVYVPVGSRGSGFPESEVKGGPQGHR